MSINLPLVYGPYSIDTGESIDENIDSLVYQVTNNETGVVEAETSSLPRAIMSTQSANLALLRLLSDQEPELSDLLAIELDMDNADGGRTH
jgi:hypothetical protein